MRKSYSPPKVKKYVFNKHNMVLSIEIRGKTGVLLEPGKYMEIEEGDKFTEETSILFSKGLLAIITNNG